jgi:hypothetical protein
VEQGSALLNGAEKSVNDIHGHLDTALDSVTRTVNHVDGLVTVVQPDIRTMASNGRQILGTVNDLVSDLNAGKGPAGMHLKDRTTKQQLQETLSNAQKASLNLSAASANLSAASARADQIVTDLQSRNLASKAQLTLDNVQACRSS